jgi:hypothetical protein
MTVKTSNSSEYNSEGLKIAAVQQICVVLHKINHLVKIFKHELDIALENGYETTGTNFLCSKWFENRGINKDLQRFYLLG